jgi:acyl carrier protein
MDSLKLIRDFTQDYAKIPPEQIVPEAVLADVGIDSLMLLELFFEFEEKMGIELPKDLPNPSTVADLLAQLDKLDVGSRSDA